MPKTTTTKININKNIDQKKSEKILCFFSSLPELNLNILINYLPFILNKNKDFFLSVVGWKEGKLFCLLEIFYTIFDFVVAIKKFMPFYRMYEKKNVLKIDAFPPTNWSNEHRAHIRKFSSPFLR